MYSIYHTEAIVLGSYDRGELNKTYALFIPDLGLVYASAQGIRTSKSKLRSHLQHYAWIDVNLVRGKRGWKITQALLQSHRMHFLNDPNRIAIFARIAKLLTRLLGEGGPHYELFTVVCDGYQCLLEQNDYSSNYLSALEIAIVTRILMCLGYWGDGRSEVPQCRVGKINESIEDVLLMKSTFIGHINTALRESHL